MQAKSNETLLKESFFTNLNDKNKIDSYEITLQPVMEGIIKEFENFGHNDAMPELKKKYKGILHPDTYHILQHLSG